MQRLEPLITPGELRRLLQEGITKGHWTLEDLDVPTEGYLYALEAEKHYPGLKISPHRNPLREPVPTETVETVCPRDLDPAEQKPQVLSRNPSLPLREPMCPVVSDSEWVNPLREPETTDPLPF